MKSTEILDIELLMTIEGAKTIREYLKALLKELWTEGEGFSGKRPFGNSGWEYDLYFALFKAGFIKGKADEFGDIEEIDEKAGHKLILAAIAAL